MLIATCARTMISRIDAWFFGAEDPRRLASIRIALFTVLALRLARPMYLELASQPKALFRPLSFMQLFDRMPDRTLVFVVQIAGVLACLMAALGLFTKLTASTGFVAALLLGGMHTSIGKVMHNDVLLLLAIAPLLFAPISDRWSLDSRIHKRPVRDETAYGWPIRTALVIVAGAYFFAGLAKLMNSGTDWVLTENMRWVLYASSDNQTIPNTLALFFADRPLLTKLMAAGALSYEISWPLAIVARSLRPLYALGAVALHGGIYATMRLDYWAWIATVLIVSIDWVPWLDKLSKSEAD